MDGSHLSAPKAGPHRATSSRRGRAPAAPTSTGVSDIEVPDAAADAGTIREYAVRLSELVIKQHQARREDWAEWRAREAVLLEEAQGDSGALAEERDHFRKVQAGLRTELNMERRRRIDTEARLTAAEHWYADALSTDRVARAESAQSALVYEGEAAEVREWRRRADLFHRREEQALLGEQRAQESTARARQDLVRQMRDAEHRLADSERRAKSSEAEVLSTAYRISGELRHELDAVSRAGLADGAAGGEPQQQAIGQLSARQALQDLRRLRERYTNILADPPQ
mmetsp:Transcript_17331/g.49295  ORF Transcript_17331/g.49295 Transcript_17331/m.49295 type:complete len:284 (+) Transcript_17331:165-1016(+)